jgi:hypothetical protein
MSRGLAVNPPTCTVINPLSLLRKYSQFYSVCRPSLFLYRVLIPLIRKFITIPAAPLSSIITLERSLDVPY